MRPRQIGQLLLMSAVWGAVFMLIKYALEDFSPIEVAFFQASIGAVGLLAIVLSEGGRSRQALGDVLRRPLPALLLGALAIAAPFMLISLGELSVPSGLAGVLVSTTPMFVAVFALRLDPTARINRRQAMGLLVGLVGVALVVGIQSVSSLGQFFGALAILGAAACGALSSFVVKLQYRDKGVPPSTTTLFSLAVGAVLVAPVAALTASREVPGARSIIAVILLGLVCTALAFTLYYSLIDQIGEERAAIGNYLTPIFALVYGVVLLGESLTISAIIGLALIIAGAEITLRGDSTKRSGGEARAHQYRPHPPFHT
ncbi:MAG TPA: DMT family transporter [Rubrobacteraceae bacterium]|nr:DMT family transporter [Rubrobacteraceae bacterium]